MDFNKGNFDEDDDSDSDQCDGDQDDDYQDDDYQDDEYQDDDSASRRGEESFCDEELNAPEGLTPEEREAYLDSAYDMCQEADKFFRYASSDPASKNSKPVLV